HLFNPVTGMSDNGSRAGDTARSIVSALSAFGDKLTARLARGRSTDGIMFPRMGNGLSTQFAGNAASYGSEAWLGSIAYKALSNWQYNKVKYTAPTFGMTRDSLAKTEGSSLNGAEAADFQLQLIKSMIAAAQSDGHIDAAERERIFKAAGDMGVPREKATIVNLFRQPISMGDLAFGADDIERRSAIYLASCLAINSDHPLEQAYLGQLESALELPEGLAKKLQWQAQHARSK
ncbi:MAG: tellurite resistance TerB family protein, partial [Gammaproteobacteria bacterium]|nr:tellurite resistance TerB family protein [Gammaproteobacteria bacterium]